MKMASLAATLVLAAGILTSSTHAQDAMKALKPADSPSKVVLDSWIHIGRKLIAMAEDFPEDKYDFKATPAQRSFAEQLLHGAGALYFFTDPVLGQKPPVWTTSDSKHAPRLTSSLRAGIITDTIGPAFSVCCA